jgi:hypothetical protein
MTRILLVLSLLLSTTVFSQSYTVDLTDQQTIRLAELLWKNEGAGKVENLTVWNKNEAFPSFGIGHFIWYPTTNKGPYVEQFPALVKYLSEKGELIPNWLLKAKYAPWENREAFYRAFDETQLITLRELLQKSTSLQVRFIIQRLEKGIPAILQASSETEKVKINKSISTLIASPEGVFVLLDYINFKGEGISQTEQYQGYGWGLKQVLLAMPDNSQDPLLSFALAADEILTRRVKNATQSEIHWLKGWRIRVHQYATLNVIPN